MLLLQFGTCRSAFNGFFCNCPVFMQRYFFLFFLAQGIVLLHLMYRLIYCCFVAWFRRLSLGYDSLGYLVSAACATCTRFYMRIPIHRHAHLHAQASCVKCTHAHVTIWTVCPIQIIYNINIYKPRVYYRYTVYRYIYRRKRTHAHNHVNHKMHSMHSHA